MERALVILLTFYGATVFGQEAGIGKFDELQAHFLIMEEDVPLRTDPEHVAKLDRLIEQSTERVEQNGTNEQKALLAFIRFEQLGWSSSTDVYSRLLIGNDIWAYRMYLPKDRRITSYHRLATLYKSTKQKKRLLEVSLEYCQFVNGDETDNCLELGSVYHNLNQYDKAIEFYRLSIQEHDRQNDSFMVGVYYNNIGLAHREMGRVDSAKWAFYKTLDIFNNLAGDSAKNYGPDYVAHYKNLVEWNLLEFEEEIQERQLVLARELINGGRKFIEWNWVINGFELLADHHFKQKEFDLAELFVDSAIAQTKISHSPQRHVSLLQLKGKILIGRGNLAQGESAFQEAGELSDSLNMVETDLEANIAAAEYREKERELELGRTQKLAQEERQQRITTTVLLVAALLIILLVLVFWFQSRKSAKVISNQKKKLATSLAEKEVLLREIHHRVKNNLQVVSNMLDLGTFTETDPKLLAVLTEAKDRIKTMALIHTNLYQHDDLSAIKFKGYLNDLLRGLADTYFDRTKCVHWELSAGEELLDIDTAVPVGLIVNELVSNSYKYAFADKEEGKIEVRFGKENDTFHLHVQDNGPGLPDDFDPEKSKSLGLRIVQILVRQLEGEIDIFRDNGTHFHIAFKPLEKRKVESR